jgi:hypothetical protein
MVVTSTLPKSRPEPFAPGGNVPKCARSLLAAPFAHPGSEFLVVRDKTHMEAANKQPRVSYPNAVSPNRILSSRLLSLKTDTSKRYIAVSVIVEKKRRVSSPGAWTAPTLSKPSPVRPTQALSSSMSPRKESEWDVKNVVKEEMRADLPAARESVPHWLECPDEPHQPSKLTHVLGNEYPPPSRAEAVQAVQIK